jgi:3-carboxy-cis,cis-muconate cycloisomerase
MLFSALFVPDAVADAVGERAWVAAMLEVEAALAHAQADAGLLDEAAAMRIASMCSPDRFGVEEIVRHARTVGNPAEPLVRRLRALVGDDDAPLVHRGATSQDVVDTAAMLVAVRALDAIVADRQGAADAAAGLAERHRDDPMVARTLLQHAVPTTFGLRVAGWLDALTRARAAHDRLRAGDVLAVQFGGAAGTLAGLDGRGTEIVDALAARLGLAAPRQPWHTERSRIVELAAALALDDAAVATIAADVALLAMSDVGEVAEGDAGGSSTMVHKCNPTGAVLAAACAQRGKAHAAALVAAPAHELERAVGAWHAEWDALAELLACTGGALAHARHVLERLVVDTGRMRANLEAAVLSTPADDVGAAGALVDRALEAHRA